MKILVTGGLGYIGSHIAKILGKKSIIIDDQSNSNLNYKKYLPLSKVYKEKINPRSLNKIFTENKIDGVIHLAGLKSVGESVSNPMKYYQNNVVSTIYLLELMKNFKINKLIFSSSSTVYGEDNASPFKENMKLNTTNPYGRTKIHIEQIIEDYCKSNKAFRAICLRYFNPIGADIKSCLSDQPKGEPQNLIPILIQAIKLNKEFKIYGNDYDTKDGTCIRDYIHIKDLANAHFLAYKNLTKIKGYLPINLGLGKGLSVLEVVKLFEKINNISIDCSISKRRKGDVAISFADNRLAKKVLGWEPKLSYEEMIKDSWQGYLKNH